MDLNISTFVSSNQENQLLLNAIKNKFDAQTVTETPNFSPPKFNIPLLKIPEDSTACRNTNDKKSNAPTNQPTQLNHFLLKQLQEKDTNNGSCKKSAGFILPQLKPQIQSTSIGSLTTAINKLQVQEAKACEKVQLPTPADIDLTTALASKTSTSKYVVKPTQNNDNLDFEIPFIDCDRSNVSKNHIILTPASNCVTDVSQLFLKHSLTEPSAIGRFICIHDNKYTAPLPLKCLEPDFRQQNVKHSIEPFLFDTKSPDDLVLIALNKYQRRHYN